MALALVLRNVSKIQGLTAPQKLFSCSSVASIRSLSLIPAQSRQLCGQSIFKVNQKSPILTSVQSRQMSADHSKLWPIEKAVSVGLLFLVPATFAVPNIVFDNLFAVATVIHFHWGLEAVVVDYIRPVIFGNLIPKIAIFWLYAISASTLGFLIYYNVTDLGIGKTVRKFWAIESK